jgi:hypothetical protein
MEVTSIPDKDSKTQGGVPFETTVRFVGAALALLAYAVLVAYVVSHTDLPREEWVRLRDVFTTVTGIAVAAAGALFGSRISRKRAERAEGQADRNADGAERGRALAAAIRADSRQHADKLEQLGPGSSSDELTEILDRHRDLADQLFP